MVKRREFLKYMGVAGIAVAVPVTLIASRAKRYSIADQIRAELKAAATESMDYYAFVNADTYQHMKLLTGEIGHYEGVQFLPQPMLPA